MRWQEFRLPLSDYTSMIEWIKPRQCTGVIVEIGVLIGNGTKQLAQAFPYKKIWAVDVFDIETDPTANQEGVLMRSFYASELEGRNQYEAYLENISGYLYQNIQTFVGLSQDFKTNEYIFLAIIDGGHSPDAVKKDFENLKESKYIAFHDYNHDIPELTKAIDEITEGMERHALPGWLIVTH